MYLATAVARCAGGPFDLWDEWRPPIIAVVTATTVLVKLFPRFKKKLHKAAVKGMFKGNR